MKLFKKLMAGAMAIAMLSAYTVAFADELDESEEPAADPNQKIEEIEGIGSYAGNAQAVFEVDLPTAAAANAKVAFTVDPQEIIKNSPPAGTGTDSTFGTVFFKKNIDADIEADPPVTAHDAYVDTSDKLTVESMSSVNVVVNMFASLSDTKMTLNDSATFGEGNTKHLYLGVKVGEANAIPITELGAKNATTLNAVAANFTTTTDASGKYVMKQKTPPNGEELAAWNKVEYTITGASNPNADWNIEGIEAPTLSIKWVVDPANVITTELTDPTDTAPEGYDAEANGPYATTWTAQLDKAAYKAGETVTLYVKPVDSTKKVKSVTFDYVSVSSKDPTVTDKKISLKTTLTASTVGETSVPTVVNGVYSVTFQLPSNMAKSGMTTGTGTGAVAYAAPAFTVTLG